MYYVCRDCGRKAISPRRTRTSSSSPACAASSCLRRIILPAPHHPAGVDHRGSRDALRRRLALPSRGASDELRARLELPEPEKIVTFDAVAAVVESLRVAIDPRAQSSSRELIGMLIEPIKVTEDDEYEIEPVPVARPFFAAAESLLLAPPDGLEPPTHSLGRNRSIH